MDAAQDLFDDSLHQEVAAPFLTKVDISLTTQLVSPYPLTGSHQSTQGLPLFKGDK